MVREWVAKKVRRPFLTRIEMNYTAPTRPSFGEEEAPSGCENSKVQICGGLQPTMSRPEIWHVKVRDNETVKFPLMRMCYHAAVSKPLPQIPIDRNPRMYVRLVRRPPRSNFRWKWQCGAVSHVGYFPPSDFMTSCRLGMSRCQGKWNSHI